MPIAFGECTTTLSLLLDPHSAFTRRPMQSAQVWICAALIVVFVASARVGVAQDRGHGTVAGIALDSLREAPLAGALVTVEGAGLSATTDSAGLFRIDSIPAGEWRLALFHPLLDTLRISLVTPRLAIQSDTMVQIVLAVPSPQTLLRIACASDSLAAVVGIASRADDATPPQDASVVLAWIETEISVAVGVRNTRREMSAAVGADGRFRLCGVPPDVEGEIVAISAGDTSGAVTVHFEPSPIAVLGLMLPGADVQVVFPELPATDAGVAAAAGPSAVAEDSLFRLPALRRGRALLRGVVTDSSGAPVAGAHVSLRGAEGAAVTDSAGRFVLAGQPSGSGVLVARKLGLPMTAVPVQVTASSPNDVQVTMSRSFVPVLREVVVRADRQMALARVGFYSRRHRRPGNLFFDVDQMDRMAHRMTLNAVLREAVGLTYRDGRILGRRRLEVRMMNAWESFSCVVYLLDGTLWRLPAHVGTPSDWIRPEDVGAIEVYRVGEAPLDLPFSTDLRSCEAVVIWTRDYLRIR